jgi:AraC-like DNA-binding protein
MKAAYEKVLGSGSPLVLFERSDDAFPFYWHYHPEYELTLIVDSSGQRMVGDSIAAYGPGDLVLLGPNLPHSWCSTQRGTNSGRPHRAIVTQFHRNCFGETFFALSELSEVSALLDRASEGLAFDGTDVGTRAAELMMDIPHVAPSLRVARFLTALTELALAPNVRSLCTTPARAKLRSADQPRIDSLCSYLAQHFSEGLDYAELTQRADMDQASLCRFFKRATGRTVTTYVNELRVARAAQMLMDSDSSIVDICFEAGFGNYSNFNRQFKHLKGIGPQSFRNRFRKHHESGPAH